MIYIVVGQATNGDQWLCSFNEQNQQWVKDYSEAVDFVDELQGQYPENSYRVESIP